MSAKDQPVEDRLTDDQLDSALRALDPADPYIDPLGERAAAYLDAILATGPRGSADAVTDRRRRPRRPRRHFLPAPMRRAALAGAAAAVLALVIVAVPTLMSDGDRGFNSWAAVAEPLAPEKRPAAAEECRDSYRDGPGDFSTHLDAARVAVAERRGDWVTVVLSGDGGFTATCITDASAGRFSGGMIGSIGTSVEMDSGARDVWPTSLGVGMVDSEELSMITGYSGTDVIGVTYSSEDHGEVVATVSQERFALWMPGDELRDAHRDGVEVGVTYADGSTEDVRLRY